MKFIFAILAITVAVAQAGEFFNENELNNHFEMFKSQYRRFYLNVEEEIFRKRTFAANLDFIFRHNLDFFAGRKTFNVAVNNFTDMSNAEFRGRFNGLRLGAKHQSAPSVHFQEHVHALPDTVDWTTKGVVTPIKDQAQCGSCWAFSAVASMEGQHALKTGKLVSLSEQNLVDCSSAEGNDGCGGGLMDQAFQYVIANKGIDTEASYSYKAVDESCEFNAKNVGTTISSYTDVKTGSEDALQNAVATIGPISVGIDASQLSFQFYSGGVYNEPECSSVDLDHGVTAVGYGTQSGQAYWKVKNSWGSDWGLQGYILMSRNADNQCGIATAASYPVV